MALAKAFVFIFFAIVFEEEAGLWEEKLNRIHVLLGMSGSLVQ